MPRQIDRIQGVELTTRQRLHDERGWFLPALTEGDPPLPWVLLNFSHSEPGALRGLHYQDPHPQNKFLMLLAGALQDIVADLRPDSPTYQCFAEYDLEASGPNQIFVPRGCAHGFLVVGDEPALVAYLGDAPYRPEAEKTLFWDDPAWKFPWRHGAPILSPKDRRPLDTLPPTDR